MPSVGRLDTRDCIFFVEGREAGNFTPPAAARAFAGEWLFSPTCELGCVVSALNDSALRYAGAPMPLKKEPPPPPATGWSDRHDDVHGTRVRRARRDGQRGVPRIHRERHDGRARPGCHQEDDSPGQAWKARGDRGDGQVSYIFIRASVKFKITPSIGDPFSDR